MIDNGKITNIRELAKIMNVNESYVGRTIRLTMPHAKCSLNTYFVRLRYWYCPDFCENFSKQMINNILLYA